MLNKNYIHFSAEHFASDFYFQKWILENDYMTNLFWENWLADNPQKKSDTDLAIEIVKKLNFKEHKASPEEFNEVWKNIKETHVAKVSPIEYSRKSWYLGIAASVVLLISSGIFFFKNNANVDKDAIQISSPQIINSNIKTGTDKAILTLADGSEIALTKGETYNAQNASSNGEEIIYNTNAASKEIVYNYLTTPRGGQFFIELSDGTQVWLNSESQLKYPVTFLDNQTREIELVYGEAYFDVSPSTAHKGAKFKVVNQGQDVEVLGTEFNIKAYKDELNIYTTLIEGKVMVNALNRSNALMPNEQLKLNLTNSSTVISTVDTYREISWKNGVFSFKNKPLKEIMKVLSRWYEIDVTFENKALENIVFNGTLKKKLSVNNILETICSSNNIDYEINDKTVLLK